MMKTKAVIILTLLISTAALSLPVFGQSELETVASGLNNPRLLSYGSDGTLYIAEAGTGGDTQVTDAGGNPVLYGTTARVSTVANMGSEPQPLVENLPSVEAFNNVVGVNAVWVDDNPDTDEGLFAVVVGGPTDIDGTPTRGVQILDSSLTEQRFIDIGAVEDSTNPDGDDLASNPIDIAYDGTTWYILDASGNALYTVEGDGEPTLFHVWDDLPVPSAVAVGPEGDVYVGFLSSFPFATGSARIERWTAAGELVETYGNLTGVTDVHVGDDGTVYAVEFASGFGDTGWLPDSGQVVVVTTDAVTPLLTGLNFPYGLAQAPDGSWVVSINSAFVEPGTGAVVRVPTGSGTAPTAEGTAEATADATQPAAEATPDVTPEATVESTAEATSEVTPEATVEATAEATSEATAEATVPA
ncbi:MAG: ScyD/ScyE family protein [Chloroflexi bacterium]|nr:ScyD/ScyE family protein [Chloroflexota bacterium]MCC6892297.1 ScyD/ScyE family protein [Anaerolineae bacterium]